jgi:hypothetical protein
MEVVVFDKLIQVKGQHFEHYSKMVPEVEVLPDSNNSL